MFYNILMMGRKDSVIEIRVGKNYISFLKDGKLHRVDGPAYITKDGVEEYWFEGIKMTDSAVDTVKCYSKNKEDILNDFKNDKIINTQTLKYRFFS